MKIDVNCDMGEWRGFVHPNNPETHQKSMGIDHARKIDETIMPYISSANIACGMHAGDPASIEHTIKLALNNGVHIGAHPGFPDQENFGRKYYHMSADDLTSTLLYQIGALKSMAEALGGTLRHVKPHGALYNAAATDYKLAQLIVHVLRSIDPKLILFGLPHSELARAAQNEGITFFSEVFADRAYNNDGSLVDRKLPGAVITDVDDMIQRVKSVLSNGTVITRTGKQLSVTADTICIHSDNPLAPDFVKKLAQTMASKYLPE